MAAFARTPKHSNSGLPKHGGTAAAETTGAALGAAAGAVAGAIAGPPGAIAGAVLGAVAGAATGKALMDDDTDHELVQADLDAKIGVTDGYIGASMTTMPARIGAFSAGSCGAGENATPNEEGGTGVVGTNEG